MVIAAYFLAILALVWSVTQAPEAAGRAADMFPALEGWLAALCLLVPVILQRLRNFRQNKKTAPDVEKSKKGNRNGSQTQSESIKSSPFLLRIHLCDWLVLLFGAVIFLSFKNMSAEHLGNIRYGANALSCWLAAIAIYFFFRMLRVVPLGKTIIGFLLLFLFSIALSESLFGIYTYTLRDPAFRKAYLKDPDAMLAQEGMNYPAGSQERLLLEKRLLASTEPIGTYGLTNTLAGVLTPWTVLLCGALAWTLLKGGTLFRRRSIDPDPNTDSVLKRNRLKILFGGLLLLTLPMAICLLLTKSRSAVLAVLVGVFLFGFFYLFLQSIRFPKKGHRQLKKIVLFVSSIVILALIGTGLALMTGILDREVFTESGKSLGYRLEYWRASSSIICDYPLFGIGPGNFQTMYPHYMLPISSEVIADPHNFFFEITVLFGIPAFAIFAVFTVTLLTALFSKKRIPTVESANNIRLNEKYDEEERLAENKLLKVSCLALPAAAVLVAFGSLSTSAPVDFTFLLIFLIVSGLLIPAFLFLKREILPLAQQEEKEMFYDLFLAAGAGAVLVNLVAAGGIAYPSVFLVFWTFAALEINSVLNRKDRLAAAENDSTQPIGSNSESAKSSGKNKGIVPQKQLKSGAPASKHNFARTQIFFWLLAVLLPIALLNVLTQWHLPAIRGEAESERWDKGNVHSFPNVVNAKEFCAVDPHSIDLARIYYFAMLQYYNANSQSKGYQNTFLDSRKYLLEQTPNSAPIRELMASSEWIAFQKTKNPLFLDLALNAADEMTTFFPTDARKHLTRGIILQALNRTEEAQKEFVRSIELDDQMKHEDRKLKQEERQIAENGS